MTWLMGGRGAWAWGGMRVSDEVVRRRVMGRRGRAGVDLRKTTLETPPILRP